MRRAIGIPTWLWVITIAGLALVARPHQADGGFWALPLEAELDLAEAIVVGRLVKTEPLRKQHGGSMVVSKGTISVRETLKGKPAKERSVTIVTRLDRDVGMEMQSPPRTYGIGTDGIWAIVGGRPSHGYGVLAGRRLGEVKAIVKRLSERKWSRKANGLRCWAGVVDVGRRHRRGRSRVGLIFAVRSVSERTIYLPRSPYANVVTIVAEDEAGKKHALSGIGDRIDGEPPLVCRPLRSGETRYMHPDGEDYGYIVVHDTLPPGKYKATASLRNGLDGALPATGKAVDAWKGTLLAPPVTLVLPREGGR